ncbi:MAG: hypothetical protein AAF416_14250 [Pseudomonadota bacterium]
MTSPIVLEFDVEPRLMAHGAIAVTRRWGKLRKRSTYWRNFVLSAVATMALISLGFALHPEVGRGYALGLFVGAAFVWFLLCGLQVGNTTQIYSAALRTKGTNTALKVEFDQDGVRSSSSDITWFARWSAVDAVLEIEGGIALSVGLACIAVPDTALPDGTDRHAFLAEIIRLGGVE